MPATTDQIITVLRTGHETLVEFVATFGPDGPTHATGASEWTVAQVLSHLGSGAEITRAGLEAALAGTDGPGVGFNESVWDRWNAKSPQDQVADFITSNEALLAVYEGIDGPTRASLTMKLGFLPEPADLLLLTGMRLNEFILHTWDVMVGYDPTATLLADGVGPMLDGQALFFGWRGHPEQLNGAQGSLTVDLSEPQREFGVDLAEHKIALIEAPAESGGVLSAPAEAWLRLTSGRLAPQHTPATVSVSGDLVSLDDLRRIFPGY
jgi:uncharacterized protein (TIGR03083 family)